ncbi:MAG TPA: LLM class flavin-dependent oxidoreductase [Acetobacteraceae bacterium]|nr:LLM class flavin-dependent oxidoreductase [Acetobacteraceae bacterium]
MKFGLMIRGQHRAGDDMRRRHADDLALAQRAEALGFDCVGKAAHYSSRPYQMVQQIPFLAQVAALAPKLRLLCGVVLLPLHKPLDLAEQLATLDVMSDGKLIFGAGVGYREAEFKAFGTTLTQRARRFEENLTAIRRLWSEDSVTMRGSHFELDDAGCSVRPVQPVPVWIGANADAGIRRAARIADAWFINPHNRLDSLERQIDIYKRELDRCGKPFPAELPIMREVFVAGSRAAAIRIARPWLEEKYRAYNAWGQDKEVPAGDRFDVGFEALAEDRFLLGSPAQVAEQLAGVQRRIGCNYILVGPHLPGMPNSLALEQMQILAEQVFPAVRQLAA